jgi:hypothetical protein
MTQKFCLLTTYLPTALSICISSKCTNSFTYLPVHASIVPALILTPLNIAQPACCHNMTITRREYFSITITTHHDGNNVTPASEVCAYMLPCAGNHKVRCCGVLEYRQVCAKLHEKQRIQKVKRMAAHAHTHTACFYSSSRTVG